MFCSRPQILGVQTLLGFLGDGGHHGGLILTVGHAVPLIAAVEDLDRRLALVDELADHEGQEVLTLEGVLFQMLGQPARKALLGLIQKAFAEAIKGAKTILWNGPAGVFEFDNFTAGSRAIAEAIAKATKNGAFSLIGGGDSVACINKFGMADQVSYISTGGGALLEAIEGKVLPGIAAINE